MGEIKLISLGAQSKHKKEDCVVALEKIHVKLLSSSYLEEAKSIYSRIEVPSNAFIVLSVENMLKL